MRFSGGQKQRLSLARAILLNPKVLILDEATAFLDVKVKNQIEKNQDFMDEIGHGTAICGIIRQTASFADLYTIKMFQHDLNASGLSLIEAMKWAIP